MVSIFSIAIANALVLLRVLVLWQDNKVRLAFNPPKLSKLDSSNIPQENHTITLGRVLPELHSDEHYDALDLHQGCS